MALSDYDTLAVNETGESTNGVFTTDRGVSVEIYKTWLYVHGLNPNPRERGASTVDLQIESGELSCDGLRIHATRYRHGVLAVVTQGYEFHEYRDPTTGEVHPAKTQRGMVGVGRYGWGERPPIPFPADPPGVVRKERRTAATWRQLELPYQWKDGKVVPDFDYKRPDAEWEGVTGDDIRELRRFLRRLVRQSEIAAKWAKLSFDHAVRFNQGDAYFAAALPGLELPATAPGESATPLLIQGIEALDPPTPPTP